MTQAHAIRLSIESCSPLPCFPIWRYLTAGAMMRPPDKEAEWMSSNGIVAIDAS